MSGSRVRGKFFASLDDRLVLGGVARPRADVGKAELVEKLPGIAVAIVDAEPRGDDAPKIGSDALLVTIDQAAPMTRAWRRSSFPRPYIWRLTSLSLQI